MTAVFFGRNDKYPAEALCALLEEVYPDIPVAVNPENISDNENFRAVVCFGEQDAEIEDKIRNFHVIRIKTEGKNTSSGALAINTPCKVGEIIDEIERIFRITKSAGEAVINIGRLMLDTKAGIIYAENIPEIRLTEKEQAVLIYLHENIKKTVGREELLREVWNYAPGIDTHTIETHIYRLRQKIETGTGIKGFLITEEGGYRLCGD